MTAIKTKSEAIELLKNFKGEESMFIIIQSDCKDKTFEENLIPSLFLPVNLDSQDYETLTLEQIKFALQEKTGISIPLAAIFYALSKLGFKQAAMRINGFVKRVYYVQRVK